LLDPRLLPAGAAVIVAWLFPAVVAIVVLIAARRSTFVRQATAALFAVYVFGIAVITFWPLQFDLSLRRLRRGNWTPFRGTLGMVRSPHPLAQFVGGRDFVANVLLFAPVGLLLPFVVGRRRRGLLVVALVLLIVFAFALEFVQGIAVNRTFDIDDPISGAIGAVAGAVAGTIIAVLASTP
jgi:glycopeptide antibiotics resistance protein